ERPVREDEGLRKGFRPGGARPRRLLRGRPAASGEPGGDRQCGCAEAGALDQRSAGQLVGHSVPSSLASTTNVASGLKESATDVPGSWAAAPASWFWT